MHFSVNISGVSKRSSPVFELEQWIINGSLRDSLPSVAFTRLKTEALL